MAKMSKRETELNEQDSLQDMLNTEKLVMDSYLLAIKEGSTKSLRTTFMHNFNKAADDQYTLFKQMQEKGYYQLQPAQKMMLDQKTQDFSKISKEIAQG